MTVIYYAGHASRCPIPYIAYMTPIDNRMRYTFAFQLEEYEEGRLSISSGHSNDYWGSVKIKDVFEQLHEIQAENIGASWYANVDFEYVPILILRNQVVPVPKNDLIHSFEVHSLQIARSTSGEGWTMKWFKDLDWREYFAAKRIRKLAEFEVQKETYQINEFITTDIEPNRLLVLVEHVHDAGHTVIGNILADGLTSRYESNFKIKGEDPSKAWMQSSVEGVGLAFIIGRYQFWFHQQEYEAFNDKRDEEDEFPEAGLI